MYSLFPTLWTTFPISHHTNSCLVSPCFSFLFPTAPAPFWPCLGGFVASTKRLEIRREIQTGPEGTGEWQLERKPGLGQFNHGTEILAFGTSQDWQKWWPREKSLINVGKKTLEKFALRRSWGKSDFPEGRSLEGKSESVKSRLCFLKCKVCWFCLLVEALFVYTPKLLLTGDTESLDLCGK